MDVLSSEEVVLSVLFEPSSLLLLQEKKVKPKSRMIKKMMSVCLNLCTISGIGKIFSLPELGFELQESGILLGGVSDCEVLVWVTHRS